MVKVNKNVFFLSLAFFFIFFTFSAIQQFVTPYFNSLGHKETGFISLGLIYIFFILANLISAYSVQRFGAKKNMFIAAIFYAAYTLALISKSPYVVYVASVGIGIAAALLWTGQSSYLIRASNPSEYGKSAGIFNMSFSIGRAFGVMTLGILINYYNLPFSFFIMSLFTLGAFVSIARLDDIKTTGHKGSFKTLLKALKSVTALKLSLIWFSLYFIFGLVIGILPLEIERIVGIKFVGPLSAYLFAIPIFLSYFIGKLSDRIGRSQLILSIFILTIASFVLLTFSQNLTLILVALTLLGISDTMRLVTYSLIGDFSDKKNVEQLSALFSIASNIGIVAALLMSGFLKPHTAYILVIVINIISVLVLAPIIKRPFKEIQGILSKELG